MSIVQVPTEAWAACIDQVGREPRTAGASRWIIAERRGQREYLPVERASFDTGNALIRLHLADGTDDRLPAGELWIRKIAGQTDQILVISPESTDAVLHLVRKSEDGPERPVAFSPITRQACEQLLGRNNVGRIAYVKDGEPRILPVHYVYRTQSLYGRTSPDSELGQTVREGDPVAFEVDEVDDLFNWRSVIVRGRILLLPPESSARQSERGRALGILRTLIEGTFGETDPTPDRTHIFRIPIENLSGKMASS